MFRVRTIRLPVTRAWIATTRSYQNVTRNDGIGDVPYVIDNYSRDRYPLVARDLQLVTNDLNCDLVDIKDLATTAAAFGSYPDNLKWIQPLT